MPNWIKGVVKKMEKKGTTGAFAAQAKRAGKTTKQFTKQVLDNKTRYSTKTQKRATLAKTFANMRKKKK